MIKNEIYKLWLLGWWKLVPFNKILLDIIVSVIGPEVINTKVNRVGDDFFELWLFRDLEN